MPRSGTWVEVVYFVLAALSVLGVLSAAFWSPIAFHRALPDQGMFLIVTNTIKMTIGSLGGLFLLYGVFLLIGHGKRLFEREVTRPGFLDRLQTGAKPLDLYWRAGRSVGIALLALSAFVLLEGLASRLFPAMRELSSYSVQSTASVLQSAADNLILGLTILALAGYVRDAIRSAARPSTRSFARLTNMLLLLALFRGAVAVQNFAIQPWLEYRESTRWAAGLFYQTAVYGLAALGGVLILIAFALAVRHMSREEDSA